MSLYKKEDIFIYFIIKKLIFQQKKIIILNQDIKNVDKTIKLREND